MFLREPTLPLDTSLAPRKKYYGSEVLSQSLERMNESHYLMRKHVKEQAKKNEEYSDKYQNAKDVDFKPGDSVYLINTRTGKMDPKCLLKYTILVKMAPIHLQFRID